MANVDSDEHRAHLGHQLRELHGEEVATDLAVHLLQDVGCLRQVERVTVASGDDLRWHAVVSKHLLVHLVVVLASEHSQAKSGMFEVFLVFHHVLPESEAQFFFVLLVLHLDPVRLFNLDLELTRCLDEVVVDLVSDGEVVPPLTLLVDHDPLVVLEMDCLLNGKLPENVLVTVNDLIVREDLRSAKNVGLHLDGNLLDAEVPVLDRFLVEELLAHLLDLVHLVLGSDPRHGESISHSGSLAHTFWYSVEHAELRWQVVVLVGDLDEEERLLEVCDLLVVDLREVLGD